jgi:hypothetical protein
MTQKVSIFFYIVTQQYTFDYYYTVCFLLGNCSASESIQHSEHGKSLTWRILLFCCTTVYIDNHIWCYTHSTYWDNVYIILYTWSYILNCHNPCSVSFLVIWSNLGHVQLDGDSITVHTFCTQMNMLHSCEVIFLARNLNYSVYLHYDPKTFPSCTYALTTFIHHVCFK